MAARQNAIRRGTRHLRRLESLHETLHLLSTPGAVDDLHQADVDAAAGDTLTGEVLRRRYGLGPRA